MQFAYPIEACDVDDHAALAMYRAKLAEWYDWLQGSDPHSIWNQISGLLWTDSVFRLVNESRGLAREAGDDWAALNGHISHFIDQGYVSAAVLGIRRLTDPKHTQPSKQVISLRRLVEDVKEHLGIITRQNFVCYDGLPFDVEPARSRRWEMDIKPHLEPGQVLTIPKGGPNDSESAEDRHYLFDLICAGSSHGRARQDQIDPGLLESCLTSVIDSGRDIREFGNKFVAHAADPTSRETLTAEQQSLTIVKIETTIRRLVGVASVLSLYLFETGHDSALPQTTAPATAHLNRPWLPADMLPRLGAAGEAHERRARRWPRRPPLRIRMAMARQRRSGALSRKGDR